MTIFQIIFTIYLLGVIIALLVISSKHTRIEYTSVFIPKEQQPIFLMLVCLLWPLMLIGTKFTYKGKK